MSDSKHRQVPWMAVAAGCLLFALAYAQDPLFTSNQNTYFLPGLARAGFGFLSADWLARQTDAVPVFSFLVYAVESYGSAAMFYVLHGLLAAIYAGSLFALARTALGPRFESRLAVSLFFLILTLAHCPWVFDFLLERAGSGLRVAWRLENLMYGVAAQYTLGKILQPSMFGILMITSVAFFARGRVFTAVLCAVAAGYLHTSMVLHAGILTAAYMLCQLIDRRPGDALKTGVLALVSIAPIAAYLAFRFVLADPHSVHEAGGLISADLRQPHHALVSVWFTSAVIRPLAWIGAGLTIAFLHRRVHRTLWIVLAAVFGIAVLLTALQAASGSRSLALLFPWRTSAWLVPACAALVLAWGAGRGASLLETSRRTVATAVLVASCILLTLMAGGGLAKTISVARHDADQGTVTGYAREHAAAGQRYLIPLDFDRFRLAAGVPVFVDWKSFPYRSREILEWYDRVTLAKAFYETRIPDSARAALRRVGRVETVTHAIVEGDGCALIGGVPEFRDARYTVCRLSPDSIGAPHSPR